MSKLVLNGASVSVMGNTRIEVGEQPYDEVALKRLREQHGGSFLIRRGGSSGDKILAIPLRTGLSALGMSTTLDLEASPWLVAPLVIEVLADLFHTLGRPIARVRGLRVTSQKPANLIPSHPSLPAWLQRRVAIDFDTRLLRDDNETQRAILICGVRTRNVIDANCTTLLQLGVPLLGRYVVRLESSHDVRFEPYSRLVGRVKGVSGTKLLLEDFGEGPPTIEADVAFLEARKENVALCASTLVGSAAPAILARADLAANEQLGGQERLRVVQATFDYLRNKGLEVVPGVLLVVGPMLGSTPEAFRLKHGQLTKPLLVFDPSGTRTDTWNERGLDTHGPYDQRTFGPKELRIVVICQARYEGQVDAFFAKFLDGLPDVKVGNGNRTPYAKGFIRRYGLQRPKVKTFTAPGASSNDYLGACRDALTYATAEGFQWDLAIVQIEGSFRELEDVRNPYFATKAFFLKQRVAVQEVTAQTVRTPDQQLVYILNNISVATYAKVGGVPWLLKSPQTVAHELVIGIGSQTVSTGRLGDSERIVGLTTVFSSDGRYLLDDLTAAVRYDDYANALFESLKRSIEQVRLIDNWRSTDAVRLVFHVFKQMADREADAVEMLIERLGLTDVRFAFLHVVDDHPFALFDEANRGSRAGTGMKGVFAPERGTAVTLSPYETLLSFIGGRELKKANDGLPLPALLRLHRRSTFKDMTYLTRQAFDFSCHTWRMFTPAPLPITIHYSELMARLLSGLQHVSSWDPDSLRGPVGRTRWFL